MGYVLGQYNFNKSSTSEANNFMTFVNNGEVVQIETNSTIGSGSSDLVFKNNGIRLDFNPNTNYYFHGQIKKLINPQSIYIKLVNSDDISKEQFIKAVTISGGDSDDWYDIEFIFTPFVFFDTLLFELQRTTEDYREAPRNTIISFQELSIIKNVIGNSSLNKAPAAGSELIKIGVQSRPSFTMCINGEEIHTSRSGIYEMKSGIMLVTFFSVVGSGVEDTKKIEQWQQEIKEEIDSGIPLVDINSKCFFNTTEYPKTREISSFTLDYVYKEE